MFAFESTQPEWSLTNNKKHEKGHRKIVNHILNIETKFNNSKTLISSLMLTVQRSKNHNVVYQCESHLLQLSNHHVKLKTTIKLVKLLITFPPFYPP